MSKNNISGNERKNRLISTEGDRWEKGVMASKAERIQIEEGPEMEFLYNNVTEDSSLLLPCDSLSFYWRISKNKP
jgi:hypothetical protein